MKAILIIFTVIQFLGAATAFANEVGQVPFDRADVDSQAYWYSRYNLGHLVMRSGMGEQLKPNPVIMKQVFKLVNDKTSQAKPAQNPALVKRIYNSGTPNFINKSNGTSTDFKNYRWSSVDTGKTTLEAFGWTLMKEVEWSKQFNVDFHFGAPNDDSGIPGAQQRFAGMVLCIEGFQQIIDFTKNRDNYTTKSPSGEYVAMAAISSFSQYIKTKSTMLMSDNRCAHIVEMMSGKDAQTTGNQLRGIAENIYSKLQKPTSSNQISTAIQSLAWFAATDSLMAKDAKDKLIAYAWELTQITPKNATEIGYQMRALIEAGRISKISYFSDLANERFQLLSSQYNKQFGYFSSQQKYTVDDIAAILAGLNAITHFGGSNVDQNQVSKIMVGTFEGLVNLSGLQISAPPIMTIASYERSSEISHRHPALVTPGRAGGSFGAAPVFRSSVEFNPSQNKWTTAPSNHFDTAGAMHLANEMIWFHRFEVNGFPEVK